MDIHALLNPLPITCDTCHQCFQYRENLRRHIMSVHSSKAKCPYCLKQLKMRHRPDNIRSHLKSCKIFSLKLMQGDKTNLEKKLQDAARLIHSSLKMQ